MYEKIEQSLRNTDNPSYIYPHICKYNREKIINMNYSQKDVVVDSATNKSANETYNYNSENSTQIRKRSTIRALNDKNNINEKGSVKARER